MARTSGIRHQALWGLALAATAGVLLSLVKGGSSPAEARGGTPSENSTSSLGEALNPSTPEQKALVEHLRKSGALFYGAWWCPACFQQKNLFGKEAGNRLPYVECDKTDAGRERCREAEIRAFPTWILSNGERLVGVQSLEDLMQATGFQGN
ncbi:thioredoxin [Synechococcus sp. RSCCF101]|uniref:thioredoxin family protein n=1 Tax=Synechococcus sp. RSCCF101 TaxID=2511069 RepID=UPI0012442DE5|nr:thioredoxin family protein [Synechococcus sp. RSCCF101]QEY33025.1 thioredoxin [Synechococcus sp. RSCCF101]